MKINETRFRFMATSPRGPVGRHLGRTGAKIESVAKRIATEEKLVRTGRYRSSIAWKLLREGESLVLQVGSADPIAKLIDQGSPPHEIRPDSKQALFWEHGAERGWVVPGHPVAGVHHPGTRAYMVLHRAVREVLGH
jgi:hypothetical protein